MKVGTFLCSFLCVTGLMAGLSGGADVNAQTCVGAWTPLSMARQEKAVQAAALLREAGGKDRLDPAAFPPVLVSGYWGDASDSISFIPASTTIGYGRPRARIIHGCGCQRTFGF